MFGGDERHADVIVVSIADGAIDADGLPEIIAQRHSGCRFSRCECALAGSFRKSIPRACIKAIVATVNPIADERTQFDRDRAFQFDRKIRNAASRVELVWRGDCASRTCRDATIAGSAAIALRLVRRQIERG